MALILPLLFAGFVGGWALLTLMGGERTRRISEFEAIKAAAAKPPGKEGITVAKAIAAPVAAAKPAPKAEAKADAKPKTDEKTKAKGKGK